MPPREGARSVGEDGVGRRLFRARREYPKSRTRVAAKIRIVIGVDVGARIEKTEETELTESHGATA
jgi:hypothetical protein